jgi:hypothetical protein
MSALRGKIPGLSVMPEGEGMEAAALARTMTRIDVSS